MTMLAPVSFVSGDTHKAQFSRSYLKTIAVAYAKILLFLIYTTTYMSFYTFRPLLQLDIISELRNYKNYPKDINDI